MQDLSLAVASKDGKKVISFSNKTDQFFEVIFSIDGKHVKDGKELDLSHRGYGIPPQFNRELTKMKDGSPLLFKWFGHGTVEAYVFKGNGRYIEEEDLNVPTFIRRQLLKKINFKRVGNLPIEVLRCAY